MFLTMRVFCSSAMALHIGVHFQKSAAYLQRADRGLAAGETWPCDLGPDLSRGFRALKTWMTFQTIGTERIGDAILHTCELASYLAEQLARSSIFELRAPVSSISFASPSTVQATSSIANW